MDNEKPRRPQGAWSASRHVPICVDCGSKAEVLVGYVLYLLGDVVCKLHASIRWETLEGATRINYRGPTHSKLILFDGLE